MRLRVDRIEGRDGWWIVPNDPPIGPYRTHSEAVEAKPGIVAFFQNCDKPGFITTDPPEHLKRKVK